MNVLDRVLAMLKGTKHEVSEIEPGIYQHTFTPQITIASETFEERRAYHQRGELSPEEHAIARVIREYLRSKEDESSSEE